MQKTPESFKYSLPLLPAGLRRALDFVGLVGHDDVLLLQNSPSPPPFAMRAQRPRTLIRRAIVLTTRHVEAGRSGRQAQVLWDGGRNLQGAGTSSLCQTQTNAGPFGAPGFRQRQGGLDVNLFTATTTVWKVEVW